MARREVREARHLVSRHGGSRSQTVGGEFCRRGQRGVCILSWGRRDSLRQTGLYFLMEGRKVGVGSICGREDVWNYIVQMYLYMRPQLRMGRFTRSETWLDACNTCVQQLLTSSAFPCAHLLARLCIFLWQHCNSSAPFSFFFSPRFTGGVHRRARRLPGTRWYGWDTREPLSNAGSRRRGWRAERARSYAG